LAPQINSTFNPGCQKVPWQTWDQDLLERRAPDGTRWKPGGGPWILVQWKFSCTQNPSRHDCSD